ncbi:GNAT family N-acetyltransferase [Microbacterium suaedae]|uniref:GNAT family N-acetyltransferase n=1 Tax=Microbacterium suaedae TaxID=2067813 RepID=UPI001E56109C|nr:GNAT family N-acetyltransferase [Microbacterium suaedae]
MVPTAPLHLRRRTESDCETIVSWVDNATDLYLLSGPRYRRNMDIPSIRVRPAELSDADGIADVHVQSWRETYSGVIPDRFMGADALAARKRMWGSILSRDPLPGAIAVAERRGQVVGFAFAAPSDHPDATKGVTPARDLNLYSIYLLAHEHDAGIGSSLLDAVLENHPAQLWVLSGNQRARAFYERHGFREDGSEFVDPDLNGIVEIRMVR